MKKILLIITAIIFTQTAFSQLDTIYLKNNQKIPCLIGRITEKYILHKPIGSPEYIKIDQSKVNDYLIADNFFTMDKNKDFSAQKILKFPGFSQKEIYEAMQDWIIFNQRYILSNGINYTNDEFSIIVGTLFTKEFFNLDLFTLVSALNSSVNDKPSENINTYYVRYEVIIRAKNGKAKIYIQNLRIESSIDPNYSRPFSELYTRRINKNGTVTNNTSVIWEVKEIIQEQLKSIEDHVYLVRENDTYENKLIKNLLLDDNW